MSSAGLVFFYKVLRAFLISTHSVAFWLSTARRASSGSLIRIKVVKVDFSICVVRRPIKDSQSLINLSTVSCDTKTGRCGRNATADIVVVWLGLG